MIFMLPRNIFVVGEPTFSQHLTFTSCYSIISVKVGDAMKRIIKLLAVILAAFMLSGCSFVADFTSTLIRSLSSPSWKDILSQGQELCEKAMTVVSDRNIPAMYDLFCEKNRTDALRGSIDSFISATGSEKITYGEIERINQPVHFIFDNSDHALLRYEVSDINIGDGNGYSANIILCVYSYYEKTHTGLQYMALYKDNELVSKVGSIIEYYEPKKMPTEFKPIDRDDIFADPINQDFVNCVLYCLNNGDKERFLSLFTPNMRTTAEVKYAEIAALTGAGLESYSQLFHDGLGKGKFKYDHYEQFDDNILIYDILTKDGRLLEIEMHACFIDLSTPSNEGISKFKIRLVENEINDKLEHNVISEITFGA